MRLRLDSLRADDLVDRGLPIDVQDPALVIKIGNEEMKTRRIKHAGIAAKFDEVFYCDIDVGGYSSGSLEIEVEVLNKGALGKLSIHVGRGKIALKEAISKMDTPTEFVMNLTHYSMMGRSPYDKGQVYIRGTLTKNDFFALENDASQQGGLEGVALEKLNNEHTEEMVKSIFGNVGELKEDIYCALSGKFLHTGRMYLTSRDLCFYSKLFGRVKKLCIPYEQIVGIALETVGPTNYVVIRSSDKEYKFWSFWDTEDAYFIIKGYQENYVEEHKSRRASLSSQDGESVVRAIDDSDDASTVADGEVGVSVHGGDDLTAFEADASTSRHKIEVVKGRKLPVSVAEYAELFIVDDAPHSIKAYHASVKDTKLELSKWNGDISAQSQGMDRDLKFFKPVNLPGLASTRGVKLQRYKRFGDVGLTCCSSTRLEDVPAADCFSVDDSIVVRSSGEKEVTVDISFEVVFLKSTFLKRMIEGPTNSEMKKWMDEFFKHLLKVCTEYRSGGAGEGVHASTNDNSVSSTSTPMDDEVRPQGYTHGEGEFARVKLGRDKSKVNMMPRQVEVDKANKEKQPAVKRIFAAAGDLTHSLGDLLSSAVEQASGAGNSDDTGAAAATGSGGGAGGARSSNSKLAVLQLVVLVLILWVLWSIDAKMGRMLMRLQKIFSALQRGSTAQTFPLPANVAAAAAAAAMEL